MRGPELPAGNQRFSLAALAANLVALASTLREAIVGSTAALNAEPAEILGSLAAEF